MKNAGAAVAHRYICISIRCNKWPVSRIFKLWMERDGDGRNKLKKKIENKSKLDPLQ